MTEKYFGKKPARRGAIRFQFSSYLTELVKVPATFGHVTNDISWGMLGNDRAGCCVVAGAAHEYMLWCIATGRPVPKFSDANILREYQAASGWNGRTDDPSDTGLDMQQYAERRRTIGVPDASGARHRVKSYAAVHGINELLQATYLFGSCGVGFAMPESTSNQFDAGQPWSVVRGSNIVGGHYVNCLSGDTKIKLLNGTSKAIRDLVNTDQWVYAIDKDKHVVPARAINIRKTGTKRMLRIHLDNGEFFDCTPDHLIMTRSGRYKKAKNLSSGSSLMPLYYGINSDGYEQVFDPGLNKRETLIHRSVAKNIFGPILKGFIVHHKDNNKLNNIPENLEIMSNIEHAKLHWNDEERRAKHDLHLRTNTKLQEHRKNGFHSIEASSRTGKKYGPINIKKIDKRKAALASNAAKKQRMLDDPLYAQRIRDTAKANGAKAASPEAIAKRLNTFKQRMQTDPEFAAKRIEWGRQLGNTYGKRLNHKVVSVEPLKGKQDVYDMEVPGYHNFALTCGVFVHNCVGRNSKGNLMFVTWGRLQAATPEFVQTYMDEAVAYVSTSYINPQTGLTPELLDEAKLDADLAALSA